MSLIQRCPLRGVPLYKHIKCPTWYLGHTSCFQTVSSPEEACRHPGAKLAEQRYKICNSPPPRSGNWRGPQCYLVRTRPRKLCVGVPTVFLRHTRYRMPTRPAGNRDTWQGAERSSARPVGLPTKNRSDKLFKSTQRIRMTYRPNPLIRKKEIARLPNYRERA